MKVAIVDDSKFTRQRILTLVSALYPGVEVSEFGDPVAALQELPALAPDLITLDMIMPSMNGLDLLAKLREQNVPSQVVVITADVQKSVRDRCMSLRAAFIEKPVTEEKFLDAVERLKFL